ncbi:right-handed parallel beta-helix repeat-containing protein [Mucilaginibacter ginsenosidivorax]|uniref:Right-handed parallel beta-helix repeat-containing protein n=1 Tax=Mucilaginibacter ginsenosidivorax TaxID=862126 RepID=A0A5B8W9G7_9SPHI|nr:hypothetical protein [Mucilaginibacter ginsenosidivorax]QEC78898.1 hypothetical protein FSB76_24205 [Mucilaginibacter ginsenosidivorax]
MSRLLRTCCAIYLIFNCGNLAFGFKSQSGLSSISRQYLSRIQKPQGTIYFVSPNGSDFNKGNSRLRPWKTIQKVNATKFNPGDQILFEGGHVFIGNLIASSNGADSQYIRYSSYGKTKAIIDARLGTGIYVLDKSNIWVDSLIIRGGFNEKLQNGNSGSGIEFRNDLPGAVVLGTCYVSNCDISGFFKAGIQFLTNPIDQSNSGFSNLIVYANNVHDNSVAGISSLVNYQAKPGSTDYAFGNVYIGFNRVCRNLGYKPGNGNHTGDGIVIGSAGGGIIEHNMAWDNGWNNTNIKGGPAAIWCWDSTEILFQFNEAFHNGSTSKVDGDGFDLDGGTTNCIMQYNYSHDNAGAGFLLWEYGNPRGNASHNIIRYNISKSDGRENGYSSIYIGANTGICNDNVFYNNTCYNFGSCVQVVDGNVGNRFFNNVFYSTEKDSAIVIVKQGGWFLNNDYYNSGGGFKVSLNGKMYYSLSELQSSGVSEALKGHNYGYNIDPLFDSPANAATSGLFFPNTLRNFNLSRGSLLKNAGIDRRQVGLNSPGINYNGLSLPNEKLPDIGACGYKL